MRRHKHYFGSVPNRPGCSGTALASTPRPPSPRCSASTTPAGWSSPAAVSCSSCLLAAACSRSVRLSATCPGFPLDLAAVNGASEVVLSGATEAIEDAARTLEQAGITVRRLNVSHAFHSQLMDPMTAEFASVAAELLLRTARVPDLLHAARPAARRRRTDGRGLLDCPRSRNRSVRRRSGRSDAGRTDAPRRVRRQAHARPR